MCPFKFKSALAGLLAVATASWLFADAVVDQLFDDNQNELEYYWYYYEDNSGVGPNDRPQLFPALKPTIVNVPFTEKPREAFGDATDTWKVKVYDFTTTESLSKKCATVPFTFGDAWEAGYCAKGKKCAMPFVGIGTMLTKEGAGMDLTGVTTVRFYAKSRVNDLTDVTFKIETLDINEYSNKKGSEMEGDEFGYYGSTIAVAKGDWQLFEINVADLALPGDWAHDFDFDIKNCTKLAWEVKGDGVITKDTLDIADVSFIGTWKFNSPSMCIKEETARPANGWFATFDQAPFNQTPVLKSYWYAYNDVEIQGTSSVDPVYAIKDDSTGKLDLNFIDATGNPGKGAALLFTLGKPIPKDSITILGFVGVGVNLYDSAKTKYWDAATAGAKSVYFEYMSDGAKNVTFELSDFHDVGDATTPTRKDSRGSGIVYYRNFPDTKGEWKKVLIPFDSLVVHDTWEGYKAIPLDKTRLAKAQWKIQGAQGLQGLYAIDNIAFPGVDFGTYKAPADVGIVAHNNRNSSVAGSFNAAYIGGVVRATWTGASRITGGKMNLINTRGSVVASAPVVRGMIVSAAIPAAKLPAGKYIASLNAIDAAGKTVSAQAQVNIVK